MSIEGTSLVISWPFKIGYADFFIKNGGRICAVTAPVWECGWHSEYGDCWHDAEGWMVIDVVSRHKPSQRHMERFFVNKQLFNPFGQAHGRKSFHCLTEGRLEAYRKGWVVGHTELSGEYNDKLEKLRPFITPHKRLSQAILKEHCVKKARSHP